MSVGQHLRVVDTGHSRPLPSAAQVPAFSYAFQPIVNVEARKVVSYEALVRGPGNEPAFHVLERVPKTIKYQFDQDSRVAAIARAAKLGLDCHLNLNFLPQGLYETPTSISATLDAAVENNVPIEHLNLELTEEEVITDCAHFAAKLNEYRRLGLKITIDDFGAGYAGLNLLAELQPDQVKIDMNLVRGIDKHGPRQAIVCAIAQACTDLGIDVLAEGIETAQEYHWFADQGIYLFQGYLFSKPGFECFPPVCYPASK
jgi:blue light- and temperature-responsive anti-repressor